MQHRARSAAPGDFPLKGMALEYDRINGHSKSTSWDGTIAQVTRDATGRLGFATTTGNVRGATETISNTRIYNPAASRYSGPTQLIDARNNSSFIAYDDFGLPREFKQTGADIPTRIATVRRGVDASDNMPITVLVDPKARASIVKYDSSGRPVRVYRRVTITSEATCPGHDNDAVKPRCFVYTTDGGAQTSIAYGSTGAADSVSIATSVDRLRYPWIGVTEITRVTDRHSSGQIKNIASAAGYATRYGYDGLSRLKSVQSPAAAAPTAVSYYEVGRNQDQVQSVSTSIGSVDYVYDPQTRQDTMVDARGVATTRFYNPRGALLRVVERAPLGASIATTQYFYDSADRLAKTVLPNGAEVVYEYDGLGRVLGTTESDSSSSANVRPTVTSTVNPAGYSVTLGQAFQIDINATDANGDSLAYTLINPPAGMTIDNRTGLVRWSPSASHAGAYEVVVQVLDNNGGVANVVFSLDVWPASALDTDGDGVPDAFDILPNDVRYARDRDFDLQPDEWEAAHNLVIGRNDAYEDADGDGLENLAEFQRESDPNASDTDGDEMSDGDEVALGRNPVIDERAVLTILNSIQE